MEDLVGKRLGEYEIVELIGHGAAADVYKAFQPKLNRYVAIKVLSPAFADEHAFRERFTREAQAVAKLDHPNILPVYSFDQEEDLVYFVMRYVDTGSLDDLMGRPMPLDLVIKMLQQVGSALSYAHSQGVVHRDVKPSNILLGPDNWVLLTDFGLVKLLETPSSITPTGMSLGTPAYMAPEQVTGDRVDAQADVYALGATLYQMVTGRVPYEGDSGMAVALKHVSEALIPPRSLNPDLLPAVDRVIAKALAKDRDLRYKSVDELVTAFREAAEGTRSRGTRITPVLPDAQAQPTPARGTSVRPSTPPAPIPVETIWRPEPRHISAHGGGLWSLLATIAGILIGFSLLLWGLSALLGGVP